MKIALDAQLIFEKQKTGIGWTADYILRNIIKEYNNEYCLNYFSLHRPKEKENIIREYKELGYKTNKCSWFHNVIYRKIWNTVPIPYSLFFGKEYQITQFFNYDIPPGVKGKSITFVYDMVYKAFPETVSKKTKEMLDYNLSKTCERADHIVTISEFSKNEIMKYMHIPKEKISIMPCGVDLSIYHSNYGTAEITFVKNKFNIQGEYFLYLGTLEPRKNITRLIEAYALLKREMIDIPRLVLAGRKGWQYDEIFDKVKEHQLGKDIIFTGYVEACETPLLLNGAKAFIFPSIYEGFGLPPLEAMACGIPVIASNAASLPEVVGNAGILVDPYSIFEIKDAMKNVIINNMLRQELQMQGIQHAKKFDWTNSVKKLMDIYEKVLKDV